MKQITAETVGGPPITFTLYGEVSTERLAHEMRIMLHRAEQLAPPKVKERYKPRPLFGDPTLGYME